jgi:hypothetical protein
MQESADDIWVGVGQMAAVAPAIIDAAHNRTARQTYGNGNAGNSAGGGSNSNCGVPACCIPGPPGPPGRPGKPGYHGKPGTPGLKVVRVLSTTFTTLRTPWQARQTTDRCLRQ